ncbi:unnamed protein product [Vitrella brassicaformis CCMP3155]|uniref:Uncharacterized protein n=1 Tax=Vitrella brassicaformis (strain CCMP3155) TaxID=1169540 RepID=A0A0G4FKI9_VITBC|nr:unnamed protein product [Vitrella brassicaformis CCMP3155]|eukprot:CEM14100.1 unnamed protein product [Vitrella brassicaformis CCMP3155]
MMDPVEPERPCRVSGPAVGGGGGVTSEQDRQPLHIFDGQAGWRPEGVMQIELESLSGGKRLLLDKLGEPDSAQYIIAVGLLIYALIEPEMSPWQAAALFGASALNVIVLVSRAHLSDTATDLNANGSNANGSNLKGTYSLVGRWPRTSPPHSCQPLPALPGPHLPTGIDLDHQDQTASAQLAAAVIPSTTTTLS